MSSGLLLEDFTDVFRDDLLFTAVRVHRDDLVDVIVSHFTDFSRVQALKFDFRVHTQGQTRDMVHDEEDDVGDAERPSRAGRAIRKLVPQLDPVVVHPTAVDPSRAVERRNVFLREETRQDAADVATDAMHRKHIQGVVKLENVLEMDSQVAKEAAQEPDRNRGRGADKPGPRRDRDQACDRARAEPERGELAFQTVVHHEPGDRADRRRQVRHHARHRRTHVGRQRRPAVEPEPAEPQQRRTQNHIRHVVRLELVLCALPPAENQRVRQAREPARDVHRRPARKVQPAQPRAPPVRVPRPARDRVVHHRRPDKDKHDHWQKSRSFRRRADRKRRRQRRKHALVDRKHDIRDPAAPNRRLAQHVPQKRVVQVADKRRRRRLAERQAVAPNKPLSNPIHPSMD